MISLLYAIKVENNLDYIQTVAKLQVDVDRLNGVSREKTLNTVSRTINRRGNNAPLRPHDAGGLSSKTVTIFDYINAKRHK